MAPLFQLHARYKKGSITWPCFVKPVRRACAARARLDIRTERLAHTGKTPRGPRCARQARQRLATHQGARSASEMRSLTGLTRPCYDPPFLVPFLIRCSHSVNRFEIDFLFPIFNMINMTHDPARAGIQLTNITISQPVVGLSACSLTSLRSHCARPPPWLVAVIPDPLKR